MRPSPLLPLIALSSALGCASTSGRDWLNTPLDAAAAGTTPAEVQPSVAASVEARPRLQHTITLGESYAVASNTGSGVPAAAGAGTQVNVHTYVPVTLNNYGYGGLGYVYANDGDDRPPSPARPSQPSHLRPGQDFPSPPSYGPSFPFRSAPASPWAR